MRGHTEGQEVERVEEGLAEGWAACAPFRACVLSGLES